MKLFGMDNLKQKKAFINENVYTLKLKNDKKQFLKEIHDHFDLI
jgi:site-specific DNA-cytosine methylase